MANPGVSPIDSSTSVGRVRLMLGDVRSVPLVPAVVGQADYERFGDAELASFLVVGGDSVLRAVGHAVTQLALGAGLSGVSIKTDDLGIDNSRRGATLLDIAKSYFEQADADDLSEDYLAIVSPFARPCVM